MSNLLTQSSMMVSSAYATVRLPNTGVIRLNIMLKKRMLLILVRNSPPKMIVLSFYWFYSNILKQQYMIYPTIETAIVITNMTFSTFDSSDELTNTLNSIIQKNTELTTCTISRVFLIITGQCRSGKEFLWAIPFKKSSSTQLSSIPSGIFSQKFLGFLGPFTWIIIFFSHLEQYLSSFSTVPSYGQNLYTLDLQAFIVVIFLI